VRDVAAGRRRGSPPRMPRAECQPRPRTRRAFRARRRCLDRARARSRTPAKSRRDQMPPPASWRAQLSIRVARFRACARGRCSGGDPARARIPHGGDFDRASPQRRTGRSSPDAPTIARAGE
jgi:hypothetical protein